MKSSDVDFVGGALHVRIGDGFRTEADVFGDGAGEEERVLQHDAEVLAQRGELVLAHVDAIDEHLAALHIVEAHHERDDGGLAGAGVADDGGGLVGLDGEGDAAQDPFDADGFEVFRRCSGDGGELLRREALVGEPDVAELDAAGARAGQRIGGGGDFGRGVEELEDALAGGHGGLEDVVFVARGPGWGARSAASIG